MTMNGSTATSCPQCRADDSIEIGGTDRLCLQCRHEWDTTRAGVADLAQPLIDSLTAVETNQAKRIADATEATAEAEAVQARSEVADILASATVEDVLAPRMTAAEMIAEHQGTNNVTVGDADYLGHFVRIGDVEEPMLVVGTDNFPDLLVQRANGRKYTYAVADVEVISDEEARTMSGEIVAPVVDDEPHVATMATVAALCLTIGAQAVADDEDRTLLNPAIGWLPPPASDIPEVEQGAAYAVAILIQMFNLPKTTIEQVAESLLAGATVTVAETEKQ